MPSEITVTIWTDAAINLSGAVDAATAANDTVRRSTIAQETAIAHVSVRPVTDEELRALRNPEAPKPKRRKR